LAQRHLDAIPKMVTPLTRNGEQTLQDKTDLNKQEKETGKLFLL
jgi:hypothetical protein